MCTIRLISAIIGQLHQRHSGPGAESCENGACICEGVVEGRRTGMLMNSFNVLRNSKTQALVHLGHEIGNVGARDSRDSEGPRCHQPTGDGSVIDIDRMGNFKKSALLRDDFYATAQERIRGGRGLSIQQCALASPRSGCSRGPVLLEQA